jgi:predicted Zn-dependent peptidase
MSVHYKVLPNGMRVVTEEVREVDTVAMGVWTSVGTRHEQTEYNGVAHMVEHMLFKGTTTRSAQDIAEHIENAGGHMNAYTSREITSYHVHLLKDDFRLGLDIIADMILNATLPDEEIERESQVILQEVGMTYDTPDDHVFDLYQQTAYPGQSLGFPVLGDPEIVSSMQKRTLRNYIDKNYRAGNMIFSVAGNISHSQVEELVEKAFRELPSGNSDFIMPAAYSGGETRLNRELEQSHIVMGFRGVPRTSTDYHAAVMLSTLLGGGMSSRLFQEIREKRGLVYSIFSLHSAYHDDGQFEIYAGTGPEMLPELIPVLCSEISGMAKNLKQEEIERAKAQRRSLLLMSRESMMNRADRQAKNLTYYGKPFDVEQELYAINKTGLPHIASLAEEIFVKPPALAAIGPLEKLEPYEAIVKRIAA